MKRLFGGQFLVSGPAEEHVSEDTWDEALVVYKPDEKQPVGALLFDRTDNMRTQHYRKMLEILNRHHLEHCTEEVCHEIENELTVAFMGEGSYPAHFDYKDLVHFGYELKHNMCVVVVEKGKWHRT